MHSFSNKFRILIRLAKFALLAIPLGLIAWYLPKGSAEAVAFGVLAALAAAPGFVFCYILTILHWKSRYKGDHSDLWGVLLMAETTGWFKLIYLIRHMIPDMRGEGRYVQR